MKQDIQVKFYDDVEDNEVAFVVICAKYQDKWVWVKHKERDTLEMPGGHREMAESVIDGAKRELQEETGAQTYTIDSICFYSVTGKTRVNNVGEESFGGLFYACIEELGAIDSEIECITLYDQIPTSLTYPEIQPILFERIQCYINEKA